MSSSGLNLNLSLEKPFKGTVFQFFETFRK